MILKVQNPNGSWHYLDNLSKVTVLTDKDLVEDPPHLNLDINDLDREQKFAQVSAIRYTPSGKDLVVAQFNTMGYLMNDEGKTLEKVDPRAGFLVDGSGKKKDLGYVHPHKKGGPYGESALKIRHKDTEGPHHSPDVYDDIHDLRVKEIKEEEDSEILKILKEKRKGQPMPGDKRF